MRRVLTTVMLESVEGSRWEELASVETPAARHGAVHLGLGLDRWRHLTDLML